MVMNYREGDAKLFTNLLSHSLIDSNLLTNRPELYRAYLTKRARNKATQLGMAKPTATQEQALQRTLFIPRLGDIYKGNSGKNAASLELLPRTFLFINPEGFESIYSRLVMKGMAVIRNKDKHGNSVEPIESYNPIFWIRKDRKNKNLVSSDSTRHELEHIIDDALNLFEGHKYLTVNTERLVFSGIPLTAFYLSTGQILEKVAHNPLGELTTNIGILYLLYLIANQARQQSAYYLSSREKSANNSSKY